MRSVQCAYCGQTIDYYHREPRFCDWRCKHKYYRKEKRTQGSPNLVELYTWISAPIDSYGDDWPRGCAFDKLQIRATLDYCGWPSGAIVQDKHGRRFRVDYSSQGQQYLEPIDGGCRIYGLFKDRHRKVIENE